MDWEVVVIGAGAAGLLAAARAAERGRRTLLLEKNRKAGVKILMSGGSRCNITHDADERGIIEAFGRQGRFLHSALAALGPKDVVALFAAEGVATKVEATGKVFPVSNKALDVRDALVRRLHRSGATLALGEPVLDLVCAGGNFEIAVPGRTLTADRVLVTTGGQSYPGCGTRGDGYQWAERLGHGIVRPRPALTPVTVNEPWANALSGVTIPDVGVRVVDAAEPAPREVGRPPCRGSFLFTHFGLSGPVVLDVSRAVTACAEPSRLRLECDFLPEVSAAELDERFRMGSSTAGKRQLASLLEELPHRLREMLLERSGEDPARRAAELSKSTRSKLVEAVKRLPIPVTGALGFEKAEVTAGGVSLAEVDSSTMESKRVPNLFFAGEILDLDGPIGGYNFQSAFSTGWLAGGRL